jgi:hypothetical protein
MAIVMLSQSISEAFILPISFNLMPESISKAIMVLSQRLSAWATRYSTCSRVSDGNITLELASVWRLRVKAAKDDTKGSLEIL